MAQAQVMRRGSAECGLGEEGTRANNGVHGRLAKLATMTPERWE